MSSGLFKTLSTNYSFTNYVYLILVETESAIK